MSRKFVISGELGKDRFADSPIVFLLLPGRRNLRLASAQMVHKVGDGWKLCFEADMNRVSRYGSGLLCATALIGFSAIAEAGWRGHMADCLIADASDDEAQVLDSCGAALNDPAIDAVAYGQASLLRGLVLLERGEFRAAETDFNVSISAAS